MPNLNPARMSAPEVARLLNSTRFGFVLPQNRVYRDFSRAGFRIAAADDPRSIHLVRYIAYLVDRHNAPDPESGARPVLFGDFSYYWIGDRGKRVIKRLVERYADHGQIGYLVSQRVDARLVFPEAIKALEVR